MRIGSSPFIRFSHVLMTAETRLRARVAKTTLGSSGPVTPRSRSATQKCSRNFSRNIPRSWLYADPAFACMLQHAISHTRELDFAFGSRASRSAQLCSAVRVGLKVSKLKKAKASSRVCEVACCNMHANHPSNWTSRELQRADAKLTDTALARQHGSPG